MKLVLRAPWRSGPAGGAMTLVELQLELAKRGASLSCRVPPGTTAFVVRLETSSHHAIVTATNLEEGVRAALKSLDAQIAATMGAGKGLRLLK